MAKKFAELRAKMSPEARAQAEAKASAMLAEMPLNELRQARGLSQKMLAEVDARGENLKQSLLRISGAIQVLEEELGKTEEGEKTAPKKGED